MTLTQTDHAILEESYRGKPIIELWEELEQLQIHYHEALMHDDELFWEYLDEAIFLADVIRSRPLQQKQSLLEFFVEQQRKQLGRNDFEAHDYFKELEKHFRRVYM